MPTDFPEPVVPATRATNNLVITNRDPHLVSLEAKVRERFGTKVQLRYRQGKGSLEIKFFNDKDLERILGVIGVKAD